MRVFELSGIIDRAYDHLYVCNIPLSWYMDRRSCYKILSRLTILESDAPDLSFLIITMPSLNASPYHRSPTRGN